MKLFKKLKMNNSGSTMVEVLVGFTILVIILVECMVHIVGVSSKMIEQSKDVDTDLRTINEQMYRKDADYQELTGVSFGLVLDDEKTAASNTATAVTLLLPHAELYKLESEEADMTVYKMEYKE